MDRDTLSALAEILNAKIMDELEALARSLYDEKRREVVIVSSKIKESVLRMREAFWTVFMRGREQYYYPFMVAPWEDDRLYEVVKWWLRDYETLMRVGVTEREHVRPFLEYRALAVQAELARIAAAVVQKVQLPAGVANRLADKALYGFMSFESKYQTIKEELVVPYLECLLERRCPPTEDANNMKSALADALLEGLPLRREAIEELVRDGKGMGVRPSDKFFLSLYSVYTDFLVKAQTGTLKLGEDKERLRDALVDVMRCHLLKAVHIPTGMTMEEYLSRRFISRDELEEVLDRTMYSIANRIADALIPVSLVREKGNSAVKLPTNAHQPGNVLADVAYLEQLIHLYAFYGSPSNPDSRFLNRYTSYAPTLPEKPVREVIATPLSHGDTREKVKKELRRLYSQLVDPWEYVEEEPGYYERLLGVVDYFYRKFPELNKFMAKLMGSPLLTGETSATVQVGDNLVPVSYRYTAVDFLEFVTIRSLAKDRGAREKLVNEFVSMMERLYVVDEGGNAVSVRKYVESKGASWDVFKETLRKGLFNSIESYAEFLSKGSGSELAKHIHFRESAKERGDFFDYWIIRLSREFGVLMFEYYAELRFLGKLHGIFRKVDHGTVNTTKYLRSALRLKAALRDLAHEQSELLRSSGQGKGVEGFSLRERFMMWLGGKVSRLGKWYTEVLQARDRFEHEKAEKLLADLQARSVHRFVLEAPALLPDAVYEKLGVVDKDFVDEAIEESRRRRKKEDSSDLVET